MVYIGKRLADMPVWLTASLRKGGRDSLEYAVASSTSSYTTWKYTKSKSALSVVLIRIDRKI